MWAEKVTGEPQTSRSNRTGRGWGWCTGGIGTSSLLNRDGQTPDPTAWLASGGTCVWEPSTGASGLDEARIEWRRSD